MVRGRGSPLSQVANHVEEENDPPAASLWWLSGSNAIAKHATLVR